MLFLICRYLWRLNFRMKQKIIYSILIILTIGSGLLARHSKHWLPDSVNLYLGDILYAIMMYFIVAFIAYKKAVSVKMIITVIICYCIEISQLYQSEWITSVRATLPGRLVLGSGFLWTDLLAYAVGAAAACMVDKLWIAIPEKRASNSL